MTPRQRMLLAPAAWSILASCGGGSDTKPVSFDEPSITEFASRGQQETLRAALPQPSAIPPSGPPQALRTASPTLTAAPVAATVVTPGRFNPDALTAAQIAPTVHQFADSHVDEHSCTRGEISCDETYSARPNFKLQGSVGRLVNEDKQVHLDTEDVVQLPVVPTPMSIFIQSSASSKDLLHVTLEDRLGNRLYALPPLTAGAYAAFGWTRTDDTAGAPFRLRLQAQTGPGDHSVNYLVLPLHDAEWRGGAKQSRTRAGP